ncbi:MAG: hypothetical protein QOC74_2959, partial [Pseudonocardiales bacterium]|nr:hypothetical protein [Pseudonocardiales bacterium]
VARASAAAGTRSGRSASRRWPPASRRSGRPSRWGRPTRRGRPVPGGRIRGRVRARFRRRPPSLLPRPTRSRATAAAGTATERRRSSGPPTSAPRADVRTSPVRGVIGRTRRARWPPAVGWAGRAGVGRAGRRVGCRPRAGGCRLSDEVGDPRRVEHHAGRPVEPVHCSLGVGFEVVVRSTVGGSPRNGAFRSHESNFRPVLASENRTQVTLIFWLAYESAGSGAPDSRARPRAARRRGTAHELRDHPILARVRRPSVEVGDPRRGEHQAGRPRDRTSLVFGSASVAGRRDATASGLVRLRQPRRCPALPATPVPGSAGHAGAQPSPAQPDPA